MQQLNVVICGFDHYENIDVNPSYEVPEALVRDASGSRPTWTIRCMTPTCPSTPWRSRSASPTLGPRCWRPWMRPGRHRDRDRSQACGAQRGDGTLRHEPDERCPPRRPTTRCRGSSRSSRTARPHIGPVCRCGPSSTISRANGIPATLSSDAGTFVCNSLFYQLLHWTATQDRVLAGFVSFPPINGGSRLQNGLDLRQQVRAGRDVVRETVRYYLQRRPGDILIA